MRKWKQATSGLTKANLAAELWRNTDDLQTTSSCVGGPEQFWQLDKFNTFVANVCERLCVSFQLRPEAQTKAKQCFILKLPARAFCCRLLFSSCPPTGAATRARWRPLWQRLIEIVPGLAKLNFASGLVSGFLRPVPFCGQKEAIKLRAS